MQRGKQCFHFVKKIQNALFLDNPGVLCYDSTVGKERTAVSAALLKYIAVICMVIDHAAWAFVPTASVLGQLLHTVGRLTAPIMCFFVAEGYYHTRSRKRYLLRMAVFAVISVIPYAFYSADGNWNAVFSRFYDLGMIYTLTLGLLSVIVWNSNADEPVKLLGVAVLLFLSTFGDWPYAGVLWVLAFAVFREEPKKRDIAFCIVSVFMAAWISARYFPRMGFGCLRLTLCQFGTLLALPLLRLYNGERGNQPKWFFYIFYPAHLLVLGYLCRFLSAVS